MKISRRLAAIAVASMVLAGGISAVAHSTEGPTNVVFWKMNGEWDEEPTSGNAFPEPQDFHSYGVGKELGTEPRIALECGNWYQVDAYVATHPFGPGDKLTGPPMDAPYHQDPAQWRFVYGGDCAPQPDPIPSEKKTLVCKDGVWVTDNYVVEYVLEGKKWVKGDKKWSHKTTTPATAEDCGYESDSKTKVTNVCKDNIVVTDHYVKEYSYDKKKKAWVVGDWAWTHKDIERNALTAEKCGYTPETGTEQSADYICTSPANGTKTTTTSTTSWTQEYVWSGKAWVLGDKVSSDPVITTVVTEDDECIPAQPEPESDEDVVATYLCADPANGTGITTTTTTAWTQEYVWVDGEWVLGEKVYDEPVVTTETQADEVCNAPAPTPGPSQEPSPEPEPTPVIEEPKAPSFTPAKSTPVPPAKVDTDVPVLARTGAESTIPLALGALALVGAGALAIRRARA